MKFSELPVGAIFEVIYPPETHVPDRKAVKYSGSLFYYKDDDRMLTPTRDFDVRLMCTGDTATCEDMECLDCGERECPHGEPLHFHHDGCPARCGR